MSTIGIIPSAPVLVPELAGAAADEVAELKVLTGERDEFDAALPGAQPVSRDCDR